ncbi:hypothetical protein [Candidatus Uabimicrobium amorphum]|uniref:Uncharacterized protein n=1 Tax=Uabimicrobium amorphum TaxID=2596890 RepID=A0A5S9F4R4_UABAM|nr:hypothetical protein [Candidatus Uabimicrobium amorphum]BBM84754.1 hypothetical protein UABAM_03115 [Candidatus Uabimicrobium amorphum]
MDAKQLLRIGSFLKKHTEDFFKNNKFAKELAIRMEEETGTRFSDWIDSFVFPSDSQMRKKIEKLGFECSETDKDVFYVAETSFPRIVMRDSCFEVVLVVDSVVAFRARNKLRVPIEGSACSLARTMSISNKRDYVLSVVERSTVMGYVVPVDIDSEEFLQQKKARDLWFNRERDFELATEGMRQTLSLAYRIVDMVGVERAAHIVLQSELAYWQYKTHVGDLQKFFQDKCGLGWGNCDHLTFWSGRKNFKILVQIFETLGFRCSKSFFVKDYGNKGVQVMEHPHSSVLIVCEVHLRKKERDQDFAHQELAPMQSSGILDNWLRANGESMLKGGAKHVAIKCSIEKMQAHLVKYHVHSTKVDEKPYFKQAYSNKIASKFENFLCFVERNGGFRYFDFD